VDDGRCVSKFNEIKVVAGISGGLLVEV